MKYSYLILAHSLVTGKVFITRISDCTYRDVRERFLKIFNGSGYDILSIMEVPEWY